MPSLIKYALSKVTTFSYPSSRVITRKAGAIQLTTVLLLLSLNHPSYAAVSEEQLKKLGTKLTPLGAERAGNISGTIPEWIEDKKKADLIADTLADDTPLFTITASNADQYAEQLSLGQKALFATYPDTFRMPIYPSRRLHNVPESQYAAARKNALESNLVNEGNGFTNAWPGIPFPIPQNSLEVLWNHMISWKGLYLKANMVEAAVYSNGSVSTIKSTMEVAMPFYKPNREKITGTSVFLYYMTTMQSPVRLAGGAILSYESTNPILYPRKSWIYVSGQRRVRRLPALEYDTPNMNSEHIRVVDEINLFNGSPDRYNWRLMGKKEIYIPYNNNALAHNTKDYDSLLTPYHLNPVSTRYELDRVWVLDATLKKGKRHVYPRRVLYIDEDSWNAVIAEQYSSKNQLWRISLSYTKYYPDMPGTMAVLDAFHDLKKQSHYVQFSSSDKGNSPLFFHEMPDKKYFSPASLRQNSKR